jgi:hypothetical protein
LVESELLLSGFQTAGVKQLDKNGGSRPSGSGDQEVVS